MSYNDLTNSERFIFEWQYRMLGDFKTALIEAICQADINNLEKLRLGFPDEVDGYINYSQTEGWWPKVERRGKSR